MAKKCGKRGYADGKTVYADMPEPRRSGPSASNTGLSFGKSPSWVGAGRTSRADANPISELNKSNKSSQRVVMDGDLPVAVRGGDKPAAPKAAAPKPAAPKPKPRVSAPKRSSADDDFMADLRASASRMRDATSEAAGATSAMKDAASDFSGSFKKGGSVRGRGDGIAQRGHTKGKIW